METTEDSASKIFHRIMDETTIHGIGQVFSERVTIFKLTNASMYRIIGKSSVDDYSDVAQLFSASEAVLHSVGVQKSDFIVQCQFDGRICSADDFNETYSNSYGLCYTYNNDSRGSATLIESFDGQVGGLQLTLNLQPTEYFGLLTDSVGAFLSMQMFNETPNADRGGVFLPAGRKTSLGIALNRLLRAPRPYSNCCDDGPGSELVYSQALCFERCFMKTLFEQCQCVTGIKAQALWNISAPTCDILNDTNWACFLDKRNQYMSYTLGCLSDCPPQCTSISIQTDATIDIWPNVENLPLLELSLRKANKSLNAMIVPYLLRQARLQYILDQYETNNSRLNVHDIMSGALDDTILNENRTSINEYLNAVQSTFARVHIYYRTLEYTTLTEQPQYTLEGAIGNFGGVLGLCLGASLLSVGEYIELVVSVLVAWHLRKRRSDAVAPATKAINVHPP